MATATAKAKTRTKKRGERLGSSRAEQIAKKYGGASKFESTIKATKTSVTKSMKSRVEKLYSKLPSARERKIKINTMKRDMFRVTIDGTSPMVMSRWTKKSIEAMLGKMTGAAGTAKREKLDPEREYLDRFYVVEGTAGEPDAVYGIPAIWIKQAIIDACSFTGRKIFKTTVRGALLVSGVWSHVEGQELIPLVTSEPHRRQDMVRNATGVADIRFRPQFDSWSATFIVTVDPQILTDEMCLNLLQRAGFSIGLGEWRPAKGGDFGRFEIRAGKA